MWRPRFDAKTNEMHNIVKVNRLNVLLCIDGSPRLNGKTLFPSCP